MAAASQRAPLVREQTGFAQRLRRFFASIEPWYDWNKNGTVFRLDSVEKDFSDESTGEAYQVELQWFGLSLTLIAGRTPPKIAAHAVAAEKARLAGRERAA